MMTPGQYRRKAREALDVAAVAADPVSKAAWEATARDWLHLAHAAEVQDRLQQFVAELGDQGPSGDDGPDSVH